MGIYVKLFFIVLALFLLGRTWVSLAKRKMTDHFCLAWAFLAVLIGLAGILLQPSQIEHYISWRGLILGMIVLLGIIGSLWFLSMQVSILMRKNQELAMQTSLLNQDYMTLIRRVEELEKQNG
ncbi:hypothetical protein [uncultured Eubacterium sp.]|uniref:hypothetical protein n=1 Tax=uncultured Eubacterium sp. TaxID=165185 RepID=UPI002597D836|nr:hypothetical protein [uncultured Eubacterium sp.]